MQDLLETVRAGLQDAPGATRQSLHRRGLPVLGVNHCWFGRGQYAGLLGELWKGAAARQQHASQAWAYRTSELFYFSNSTFWFGGPIIGIFII